MVASGFSLSRSGESSGQKEWLERLLSAYDTSDRRVSKKSKKATTTSAAELHPSAARTVHRAWTVATSMRVGTRIIQNTSRLGHRDVVAGEIAYSISTEELLVLSFFEEHKYQKWAAPD